MDIVGISYINQRWISFAVLSWIMTSANIATDHLLVFTIPSHGGEHH